MTAIRSTPARWCAHGWCCMSTRSPPRAPSPSSVPTRPGAQTALRTRARLPPATCNWPAPSVGAPPMRTGRRSPCALPSAASTASTRPSSSSTGWRRGGHQQQTLCLHQRASVVHRPDRRRAGLPAGRKPVAWRRGRGPRLCTVAAAAARSRLSAAPGAVQYGFDGRQAVAGHACERAGAGPDHAAAAGAGLRATQVQRERSGGAIVERRLGGAAGRGPHRHGGTGPQRASPDCGRRYHRSLYRHAGQRVQRQPQPGLCGGRHPQRAIADNTDSSRNTRTGHAPRFITVIKPEKDVWRSPFDFDKDDSTHALSLCLQYTGSAGTCHSALSLRARLGQPFTSSGRVIVIGPWADTAAGGHVPYAADIDLALPQSGASAQVPADLGPQSLSGDMASYIGYGIHEARANRVVGTYRGIVSMAGHNLRTAIDFENLPLPLPSLSGPARVETAPGATVVAVGAGAPQPFVLAVADPVGQNIDDTTRWIITSSNPADSLPGAIQQSDGSVPFAVTFSGVGPRTLTVTSRGDAGITATFAVNVLHGAQLGQSISFTTTPAAFAKVGGTYLAAATGGGSGLPVTFSFDTAASTPGACTVAANGAVAFTGAGTCSIQADQAGNAVYAAAAQARQSFTIGSASFSGPTVPSSGAGGHRDHHHPLATARHRVRQVRQGREQCCQRQFLCAVQSGHQRQHRAL